jgi:hypothetical protein
VQQVAGHPTVTMEELLVAQRTILLFALTLRGPSGGHCVELKGGEGEWMKLSTRWGPEGPPACQVFLYLKAPRSGPRRAPGGSEQGSRSWSVTRLLTTPSVGMGCRKKCRFRRPPSILSEGVIHLGLSVPNCRVCSRCRCRMRATKGVRGRGCAQRHVICTSTTDEGRTRFN